MIEIWRGQAFEVCYAPRRRNYGPCGYGPDMGCYAPTRRDLCNTVHIRLYLNAPSGVIPPVPEPTYDGNADWRIEEGRRLLVVPGGAFNAGGPGSGEGIGKTGKATYIVVLDDSQPTPSPVAWYKVIDWSFSTDIIGTTTQAISWVALEVEHA